MPKSRPPTLLGDTRLQAAKQPVERLVGWCLCIVHGASPFRTWSSTRSSSRARESRLRIAPCVRPSR